MECIITEKQSNQLAYRDETKIISKHIHRQLELNRTSSWAMVDATYDKHRTLTHRTVHVSVFRSGSQITYGSWTIVDNEDDTVKNMCVTKYIEIRLSI